MIANASGAEMHAIAGLRFWQTDNGFDVQPERTGVYCVVGVDAGCVRAFRDVPEPSASWLLLAGSLVLMWLTFSKQ